jgi:hypothetical protein
MHEDAKEWGPELDHYPLGERIEGAPYLTALFAGRCGCDAEVETKMLRKSAALPLVIQP